MACRRNWSGNIKTRFGSLEALDFLTAKQPVAESATAIDVFLKNSRRDKVCVILFSASFYFFEMEHGRTAIGGIEAESAASGFG